MIRKFINWLFGFEEVEELDGVDDPHDPQYITRIYGGSVETDH